MSLDKNISSLQDKVYGANFDISKSYLPDKEVAKNILLSKSPTMKKDDAEIMVYGKTLNGDERKLAKSKDISFSNSSYSPTYPLPSNHVYYNEVKKTKNEVREAVTGLIKDQKALLQDLIITAVKISNAIPGITQLIAPVSFNVPAAISLLLLIVDAINLIINKIMDILKYLEPLKKLNLLIDDSKFNSVTTPINIALQILLSIFEPISLLKKFIDKLMGELNKAISQNITATYSGTYSIPPTTKDGQFDESSISSALNVINPDKIYPTLTSIKDLSDSLGKEVYVYDVDFQDGRHIENIDEKSLEEIKDKYRIIFKDEGPLT